MLPKKNRLVTKQFDEAMAKGKSAHSPLFSLRWILVREEGEKWRVESGDEKKISAVAPLKIFKTAVKRSLMRRRIYEAVYKFMASIKSPLWAIITAKPAAIDAEFSSIEKDIEELFVKSKLLK